MADDVKSKDKKEPAPTITDDQRFKFIGFEVYPGKPKDLFRSDAEREKLVEAVREKRQRGEVTRDECTLFEERVSWTDRIVLTIASVLIVATLFIPWFSVYNEIEETLRVPQQQEAVADTTATTAAADQADSAAMAAAGATADTAAMTAAGEMAAAGGEATGSSEEGAAAPGDEAAAEGGETPDLADAVAEAQPEEVAGTQRISESEEVIHGYIAKKKVYKEYERVSAIGAFGVMGSAGGVLFGSGVPVLLSTILIIGYIVLCLVLPILTLYALFGGKGTADERALRLKKVLRYNWIPLLIFLVVFIAAFFGGDYSRPVGEMYESLGDSYGIGAFFNLLSWGLIVSVASFVLIAAKGSEI